MTTGAPPAGTGRVAGAAALIAVLTVASRLAGFGRTAVFTGVVGDRSDLGDVYLLANTVPNIIFEIVAGGALASLVVPLLAGAVAAGDRATVSATTGALLTWTLALLVPLALVVAGAAEPIMSVLADGRSGEQIAAGARMLRVFAPQLPLYGVGIVLTGVLQAHRRFAWPVIAPLLSSVTVIGVYLTFAATEGVRVTIAEAGRRGELILSVGTTLGVVVLSLSLLIPLRPLGLRLRPGFRFTGEARHRVGGLALAGAVAVGAQQIALVVMLQRLAGGPTGTVVVFNLAQTLYLLPWAVLAVPLAVAAYPVLAATGSAGDETAFRATLAPVVRRVLLLACLGAAILLGTAAAVPRFFWGVDNPAAVAGIAGFAPGLLGYGLFAVLSRALYARADTRAATLTTAGGWLVVPVAAVVLAGILPADHRVLAVTSANSLGMLVLGALLLMAVRRATGPAGLTGLTRSGLTGLVAGGCAAVAGAAVGRWVAVLSAGTPAKLGGLLQGMLSGVVVLAVFVTVAYLLDREELRPLVAGVTRRLGRLSGRRANRGDAPTDGADGQPPPG